MARAETVCHPDPCPDSLSEAWNKLDKSVQELFNARGIPYWAQVQFCSDGSYCTMEDLADRWKDPETARAEAPSHLQYEHVGFLDAKKKGCSFHENHAVCTRC